MSKSGIKKTQKAGRRFSDEQVRALESVFEDRSKVETLKKIELASNLGLHPRQVAIWFQNKRARWKSRQLEHDYKMLQANYDKLSAEFDALKKDNQSLQMQLQELNTELEERSTQKILKDNLEDGGFLGWGEEDEEEEMIQLVSVHHHPSHWWET